MWVRLRTRTPGRPAFRRQHAMEPYILDFYCAAARLAVEIDGMGHDFRVEHDARRDLWLTNQGIEVMRVSAAAVMADPDMVAALVWERVEERLVVLRG
jgi:very-short-patch-repair endonuclease